MNAPTTRSRSELQTLALAGADHLGWDATAADTIAWVAENFVTSDIAVACSMQDAVLPALVAEQIPGVDVLFLDTGYHFEETIFTRDLVEDLLDVNVVDITPARTVAEQDAAIGPELFRRSPHDCCRMRKIEPLNAALSNYRLWFTGLRREEAPTRARTPVVGWDSQHQMVKVNPLVGWSLDDLINYAKDNDVPVNPLMQQGYLSIGCQPCTAPVAPGADPRSGRWAGTGKLECGIHTAEATA